jgi:hypothetical protein
VTCLLFIRPFLLGISTTTFVFVFDFTNMTSYSSILRGGGGSRRSTSSPRPLHEAPLHHIPALNENALFIDLRSVKAEYSLEERSDFLIKDLGCTIADVKGIFADPSTLLLRVSFTTAAAYERFLARLASGVPWAACNNALVYGWAPGDSITAVRVSAVPDCFTADDIRAHFQQFGRVTQAVRGRDRYFKNAFNGIVHLSITLHPGFTLPHFVEVVDASGSIATRLFVHTDDHRRRCARCGHTGHVGQYCRAGARAPGADAALWSTLSIPPALLPASEEDEEVINAVAEVLVPLLAANPAAARMKGPLDPDGPPLADWAAAVVAEHPEVPIPQSPAVETAASTPLPNDGELDNSVDAEAASGAKEDDAAAPEVAAPAVGAAAPSLDPSSPTSLSPLLLQLSTTPSSITSLPLGQGGPSSVASNDSSVQLTQVSSLSSQSASQRSARSRSPHSQRSASVNSRDSEADDISGPAKGRPGRKRGLSGGKGGPAKAVKPRLPTREATPPSQQIQQCASP